MKTILLGILAFLTSLTLNSQEVNQDTSNTDNDNTIVNTTIIEDITTESTTPVKTSNSANTITRWWAYPENIQMAIREGDDLLVLVNKAFKLSKSYAPSDLVKASLSGIRNGNNYLVRNILINDLKSMVEDAKIQGIDLSIRSGYRSYNTQIDTYNYWLSINNGNIDATDKVSARAGHSQHQLGTAIDFSSSEITDGLSNLFKNTKASQWLINNSWKYGFVLSFPLGYENVTGYSYESWHYRYIGITNAKEMHNSGVTLEKYLESKN